MEKELKGKQIAKNISLSLFAQLISLTVSFVLSVVVPKFINEYQYAYWHTFLLYVSYVGVLHFGLLDGLLLRYSQYDYDELDKDKLRSQFVALLTINTIASVALISFGITNDGLTEQIAILVAVGILTKNLFNYNSYLFQITNRIQNYAFIVIAQRLVYGLIIILLLLLKQQNYVWFCIADLAGDCAGIILSLYSNRELHFGPILSLKEIIAETWLNISSGIMIMLANWSSMLLVSGAKMIIEWKWGALIFGKTTFSFSVSSLLLTFITAISVVLFPSLKRMKQEDLPSFYKKFRDMMIPLLFWGMLLYYPECWLLEKWLPKYSTSLLFLGLLTPMIVYTSLITLLSNNYLKAYRKEGLLLFINVISVLIAFCMYVFCAYFLDNFTLMLLTVVLIIMLRSIISEMFVMKLIHKDFKKDFIIEFTMTCTFLISTHYLSRPFGFLIYLLCLLPFSYYHSTSIKEFFIQISMLLHRRRRI